MIEQKKFGHTSKRTFNKSEVRCMQSKINLKFPIKEMLAEKNKERIHVKKSMLDEFERKYKEMCN